MCVVEVERAPKPLSSCNTMAMERHGGEHEDRACSACAAGHYGDDPAAPSLGLPLLRQVRRLRPAAHGL